MLDEFLLSSYVLAIVGLKILWFRWMDQNSIHIFITLLSYSVDVTVLNNNKKM
jgi:hypothetical protein